MRISLILISVLILLLVLTNVLWMRNALKSQDDLIYQIYLTDKYKAAFEQAFTLLPIVASKGDSRSAIVSTTKKIIKVTDQQETNGYTWIGFLGFKFNDEGRVVAVDKHSNLKYDTQ